MSILSLWNTLCSNGSKHTFMLVLYIFTISPLVISLSTAQVGGGGVIVLFCRIFEHVSFFSSTVKESEIRNLTFFSCVQYMLDTTSLLMADDRYFTYKHSFIKTLPNWNGFFNSAVRCSWYYSFLIPI